MPTFIRPPRLLAGSKVAALSLSSGFVTEVMSRYQAGVRQAAEALGNIAFWDNQDTLIPCLSGENHS